MREPGMWHDYFRPFSCKGFHLCPSCSQKLTVLFAEHLTQEVLLDLRIGNSCLPCQKRYVYSTVMTEACSPKCRVQGTPEALSLERC
jgi:hypothetical protein